MRATVSKACVVRLCIALAALLLGAAGAVSAQAPTLQGVWAVTITPRDCATNAPLPVPPFRTLLTFHRDGTSTESVGTLSFAPGQRSAGHGTWAHAGGLTYQERTVAMILFDAGILPGGLASDHTQHHIDERKPLHVIRAEPVLRRESPAVSDGVRVECW